MPIRANSRGGGDCRQCHAERSRVNTGSTKTGPRSRYKGDEVARLAALAEGKKRCPECGTAKMPDQFNRDKGSPDGLSCYCRDCRAKQKREHYYRNRERVLLQKQALTFGLTVDALVAMLKQQGYTCAICRRPCPSGRSLAVDHCHTTGIVRELLCANCNRALGLLQDSPEIAEAAALYLQRWRVADGETSTKGMSDIGMPRAS